MRGIDIFCASQAATAICLSMEEGSSSSSSTIHLGSSRAIDRHNPIIRDAKRIGKSLTTPCSSQPPISPKPHTHHQRRHHRPRQTSKLGGDQKSKRGSSEPVSHHDNTDKITGKSSGKAGDHFISPPASSRYLLSDGAFLDVLSNFDPVLALVPVEPTKSQAHIKPDDSSAPKPPNSSRSTNQGVIALQGCAGKVRKHISRMQGVTSFDIDFAAKKVTVVGDVTPLEVLASVSKVKNAQLWTPAMSASGVVPVGSSYEEIKKHEA